MPIRILILRKLKLPMLLWENDEEMLTWYFLILSNCSLVGSTTAVGGVTVAGGDVVVVLTVLLLGRRAGTCGAGALFTKRPSFSILRWSRGGGAGFVAVTCVVSGDETRGGVWAMDPFKPLWNVITDIRDILLEMTKLIYSCSYILFDRVCWTTLILHKVWCEFCEMFLFVMSGSSLFVMFLNHFRSFR